MAETPPANTDDLIQQIKQVLGSMSTAGIQYIPEATITPVTPEPVARPAMTAPVSVSRQALPTVSQNSLFSSQEKQATEGALSGNAFVSGTPIPSTPEGRLAELTALAERVAGCRRCPALVSTRSRTVFGVGPLDPDLCFIGEAPGADEDAQGIPFVGAAGQLLNRIIAACGMTREEVFICNILRCRPPGNRIPNADEAANCREYLERTLELVRPRYLCCLGATASQRLLNTSQSLGKLRGRFLDYKGIPVLCTYHPAALLPSRSPEKKKDVWEDMKKLLTRMGKPIPGQKN